MYHLFNKIRPFLVGRIAQPSLIVFIHVFSVFCTICARNPKLPPHPPSPPPSPSSKLEKILHLCICTNKNNGIVQDHSRGHATLQSRIETKEQNNSREERR